MSTSEGPGEYPPRFSRKKQNPKNLLPWTVPRFGERGTEVFLLHARLAVPGLGWDDVVKTMSAF